MGRARHESRNPAPGSRTPPAAGIYPVPGPGGTVPGWADEAIAQTPPPLPGNMPLLLMQSTSDTTIPPSSNATLQVEWCTQGSTLDALWLSGISHIDTAVTASPAAVEWISERFRGDTPTTACAQPPPIDAPPPTTVL